MADMWDAVAPGWERNADVIDAQLTDATVALLDAAHVGPGDTVLELAAGPGGAGLAAARRVGVAGRIVLTDASAGMVEVATRRAAAWPGVRAEIGEQTAIEAPDASFDAVLIRHGLMFAPDPAAAVREAVRVLRPGGRYAAMTWSARSENAWLGLVFDAVGAQFGVEFPPPQVPGPFSLDDPRRLAGSLTDGGLTDVGVERIATPMEVDSLEAWWDRVSQVAGPLATALAGLEPEVREAIRARALVAGANAAHPVGEGIAMDGAVLIASGTA